MGKIRPGHAAPLQEAYRLMHEHHGHLGWWPGETPFEVCIGAILTQNTNWSNVEKALGNLKQEGLLEPRKLFGVGEARLAQLLRPSGYFRVKAKRVRAFLRVLVEDFDADLKRLFEGETAAVRQRLLGINGIGPETADSMLLYAGGHVSFVVDAYTRRIFQRHAWCADDAGYDEIQELCSGSLRQKPSAELLDYWQDYHAQIVIVGKTFCRKSNPRCELCPLRSLLPENSQRGVR